MESLGYNLSFYSYGLAAILSILIEILYAFRRQIMSYHLDALETT